MDTQALWYHVKVVATGDGELFIEKIPTAQAPRDPWKRVGESKFGSKLIAEESGNVERLVIEGKNGTGEL